MVLLAEELKERRNGNQVWQEKVINFKFNKHYPEIVALNIPFRKLEFVQEFNKFNGKQITLVNLDGKLKSCKPSLSLSGDIDKSVYY